MTSSPSTDQHEMEAFEFTGRRAPFFRLLLVNLVLTIFTLGIYRFWAKTNVRRFIWSNIRLMGDPLEYTGKGTELLLGFLIILAVLFPLGLIYEGIQSLAPPGETAIHIGLEVLYYIVIFALIQIGFYRAWRYRMSRTAWRGIRLGLDGSTWTFLKLSLGWSVLTVLTLGIAYPWMAIELWRYQITHTRLGNSTARLEASPRKLMPHWIFVMLPWWIAGGTIISIAFLSDFDLSGFRNLVDDSGINRDQAILLSYVILAIAVISITLIFTFKLLMLRHVVNGMSLGMARVHSKLPLLRLVLFALLSVTIATIVAYISAYFIVNVASVSLRHDFFDILEPDTLPSRSNFFVFIIVIFFLFLISPFFWTLIYQFEFLKVLFERMRISNPEEIETVIQSASDSQRTGEGLADALDIGGL